MKKQFTLATLLLLATPAFASAAELEQETIQEWDEYIRTVEPRVRSGAANGHFLWTGEEQDSGRRLRNGDILITPVDGRNPKTVRHGLIHDWIGAMFIPNATIDDAAAVMRDYDRYRQFYKPVVVDAKLLGRTREEDKFTMLWVQKTLFAGAALAGEYETRFYRLDHDRMYSVSYTTRVQEIRDYGRAGARTLPPGTGSGYIWRLYSVAKYEARDGGVYVELEAIALSRDIPNSIRWVVKPVVDHLSRNSMATSLEQTRDAVLMEGSRAARPLRAKAARSAPQAKGDE